jgi:arginine repressor
MPLLQICAYALLYAQFYSFVFPMPSATLEQHERRQAITRLLEAHAIQRQAELVELLRQEGFPATQSSVSRDLRDLGAAKMKNGYSLPKPTAWPEIVGTLSGDDTIFVATVSSTQQRRLRGRLRQHLKKATP